MKTAVAMLFLVACGRVGFDAQTGDGGDGDASGGPARPRTPLVLEDPGEELVDFPLMLRLDSTRFAAELAGPLLETMSITDAQGTPLAFEAEQYGMTPVVWVRVPRIAGPTTLYITYDGRRAQDRVFGDPYVGVWHLAEAGTNVADYSTYANHGIATEPSFTTGLIGSGRRFVRANSSHVVIADAPSLTFDTITLSGWKIETTSSTFRAIIGRQLGTGTRSDFWIGSSGAQPMAQIGVQGLVYEVIAPATKPLNVWYHTAATYDGNILSLYVDGAFVGSVATPGGAINDTPGDTYLGADCDDTGPCPNVDFNDAVFDELRIERGARSAAWIAYDVASMRDEVITFGALEP